MASGQSADSASSQRDSVAEAEGEGHPSTTSTRELQTSSPLHTQPPTSNECKSTTPSSQHSSSPEPSVKSKLAAPYFSEDSSESSQESSDNEAEGLGPEVSVILDDGLDTRIDLEVVLPDEGGVEGGSGPEEEEELEVPNEFDLDAKPSPITNPEFSRTTTLSPAEPLPEVAGDGGGNGEDELEEDEVEERDTLMELKPGKKEKGSGRARSETESTSRKVSLASLVGRVRSQTIQDGAKEKHLANKVQCPVNY